MVAAIKKSKIWLLAVSVTLLATCLVAVLWVANPSVFNRHEEAPVTASRVAETQHRQTAAAKHVTVSPKVPTHVGVELTSGSNAMKLANSAMGTSARSALTTAMRERRELLSLNDIAYLMAALANKADADFAAKNDIISLLVSNGVDKGAVQAGLLQLLGDASQPIILREYIVQYLADLYRARWPAGNMSGDGEQKQLLDALWRTTEISEDGIAGSALLVLQRIGMQSADAIPVNTLADAAGRVADNAAFPDACRMGALQTLANIGAAGQVYAGPALDLANDDNTPVALRLTAMHAASVLAAEDPVFLKTIDQLAQAPDVPELLKTAAMHIKSIKK